jgi:tight adherence protein B
MISLPLTVALGVLAVRLWARARRAIEVDRLSSRLDTESSGAGAASVRQARGTASGVQTGPSAPSAASVASAGLLCAVLGFLLAGLPGAIAGGVAGAVAPRSVARRRAARAAATIDRQVGEFAEGVASAVRGGLSISQAVEFAAEEAEQPLRRATSAMLGSRRMGMPLTDALDGFADTVGTEETRLLALVLGVHHRSGGNVADALDEITSTIRHRLDLRRELRAITAQGRISGAILGVLPLAFFLVLSVTSRGELEPVVRSPAGVVLVSSGLALEALAYLWIRRLLRVES